MLASLRRFVGLRKPFLALSKMATSVPAVLNEEDPLEALRLAVKEQGDLVRKLKEEKMPQVDIQQAVHELKKRKKALESKEKELVPDEDKFDRVALQEFVKRRFIYCPSFSIYGGQSGLYDFGPVGCTLKANFISLWRQHFVIEEGMLEVDATVLTPETVLCTSGHADRFVDFMVTDSTTGDFYRADHLLCNHLEKLLSDKKCPVDKRQEYERVMRLADSYGGEELAELFEKYDVKAALTGNDVTTPMEFNLMFKTSIGPGSGVAGFLRPETAQGIFVNFKRLLEFNNGRLPFAGAQVGKAYRNEITPRSGLLRVREFDMAEIEHFVDPDKKDDCPKFANVADLKILFYSSCDQMDGKPMRLISLEEAVSSGVIANKTLGYFIGRIYLFLVKIGIDKEKLRFRQHLSNEMAHYAKDCWDAECRTSYGWVECVGCADRACFDLKCHSEFTKTELSAKVTLPEPRTMDCVEAVPVRPELGKKFRQDSKIIIEAMSKLSQAEVTVVEEQLASKGSYELVVDGRKFELQETMVKINRCQKKVHTVDVTPSVIEPSFGIGRIIYALLEHNFNTREGDNKRTWLSLPPSIAPISCSVLPLSSNEKFDSYVDRIATGLRRHGIPNKVDDSSGSIGRRYARTDEIGIPYGITVDFDTLEMDTATLRERDSMKQIRAKVDELPDIVQSLIACQTTWSDVLSKYPLFTGQETI